jgi:hypothetical protein
VAGREADSQQDTQKKSQSKADRQAAGIQQQVNSSKLTGSKVVRQAGRHAGR